MSGNYVCPMSAMSTTLVSMGHTPDAITRPSTVHARVVHLMVGTDGKGHLHYRVINVCTLHDLPLRQIRSN